MRKERQRPGSLFDFESHPDRHEPRSPFDFDFESHPDRTFRLRRRTQRPGSHAFDFADFACLRLRRDRTPRSHVFDFTDFAPFDFADFTHLWLCRDGTETAQIALRSWLRNGWVLMNLTGFDGFFFGWVLMNLTGSVFIYWEMVLYICLEAEKMWEIRRKCVFYIIFSNTTKH